MSAPDSQQPTEGRSTPCGGSATLRWTEEKPRAGGWWWFWEVDEPHAQQLFIIEEPYRPGYFCVGSDAQHGWVEFFEFVPVAELEGRWGGPCDSLDAMLEPPSPNAKSSDRAQ